MFAAFCLDLASVTDLPLDIDTENWMLQLAEEDCQRYYEFGSYVPHSGDLIFFATEAIDPQVGIVCDVELPEDAPMQITLIAGDVENAVVKQTVDVSEAWIYGYGAVAKHDAISPEDVVAFAELEASEEKGWSLFSVFSSNAAKKETINEAGEIDFTQWLNKLTVEHKVNGNWEPVTGTIDKNDEFQFKFGYQIPAGGLDGRDTIFYQLPFGLDRETSGTVIDGSGSEVGTYVIDKDGKISIKFTPDYVKMNETSNINGYINLTAKMNKDSIGEGEKIDLPYKDGLNINLTVTDREEEEKRNHEDLTVRKSQSDVDENAGTVEYTITVDSKRGTGSVVHLKDVMTNIGLDGAITIKDKHGNIINSPITENGSGFDITLPKMGENDQYTITYKAKLPEAATGTVTAKNRVEVSSEKKDGGKLEDSSEVSVDFHQTFISKTGQTTGSENPGVKWTIVVNKGSNHDIGGWTLSDTLNGQEFKGEVQIEPAVGGQTTITLPFTFPAGSHDEYTITYETSQDLSLGEQNMKNSADLTKPDGTPGSSTGEIIKGGWEAFNPLHKSADSLTVNDDTATIQWHVTINADKGSIAAPWTYKDRLEDGQWFTEEQLAALEASITEGLNDAGLDLQYTITPEGNAGKYTAYTITFDEPLQKGSSFEFTYTSTAPLGDGMDILTFHNNANINNKVFDHDEIKYAPLVVKKDNKNQDGGDNTEHSFVEGQDFKPEWLVIVTVPKDYQGGDLTVTETLPEGVDLDYLTIQANGVFGITEITSTGSHGVKEYDIKTQKNNQVITITIPEALATNPYLKEIRFVVRTKFKSDFKWLTDEDGKYLPANFENKVEVSSKDGKTTGSDDQTQTIEKEEKEEEKKEEKKEVIKKTYEPELPPNDTNSDHAKNNIIPYSIEINPEGKDLVKGSDTMTMVDELEIPVRNGNSAFNASLVANSVHVYKMNDDGSPGEELTVTPTYEVSTGGDYNGPTKKYTLTIELPDNQPLIVKYSYLLTGPKDTGLELNNLVTLTGLGNSIGSSNTNSHVTLIESSAGANGDGVTLIKVDAESVTTKLAGAEFQLSEWNGTTYEPVKDKDGNPIVYVTEKNGSVFLEGLKSNTAYRLVETKAPEGYLLDSKPYDFLIIGSGAEQKPNNFKGDRLTMGQMLYRENEKSSTEITVKKQWQNVNGDTLTNPQVPAIQVELWRHAASWEMGDNTVTLKWIGYAYNWGLKKFENVTTNIPIGSTVTLTLKTEESYDGNLTVESLWPEMFADLDFVTNTDPEAIAKMERVGKSQNYSYTFQIHENTTLFTKFSNLFDNSHQGYPTVTYDPPKMESDSGLPADVYVGTCVLNSENSWRQTFDNLIKKDIIESNGTQKKVYYTYYVKEINGDNFTVSYDNQYTDEGTITVTNKMTEEPSYELPETGGRGVGGYTTVGILLMGAALVLHRRQRTARKGGC